MNTLMLLDTSSLDIGCKHKFEDSRVDYSAILDRYKNLQICHRVAFNKYSGERVQQFERLLRYLKFRCLFGHQQPNMEMALLVAGHIHHNKISALVLGTRETCHIPILDYAKTCGVKTYVCGFNVPKVLQDYAEVYDIDATCTQAMHGNKPSKLAGCAA